MNDIDHTKNNYYDDNNSNTAIITMIVLIKIIVIMMMILKTISQNNWNWNCFDKAINFFPCQLIIDKILHAH